MHYSYTNLSLDELNALAVRIAPQLHRSDVITLNGTLGAGKTAFARLIIQALVNEKIEVTSPTFSILNSYTIPQITPPLEINHFDLYRLNTIEEAYECGIEETLVTGINLIEWADIIAPLLTDDTIVITLTAGDHDDTRNMVLTSKNRALTL